MLLLAISISIIALPLTTIRAAEIETTSWTKFADMPTSRGGLELSSVSGKIYAIGGSNNTGDLAVNEMYNPATDRWSVKSSMPTARTGFATAVYENNIYAIGGSVGNVFMGNVEAYDTLSDVWYTLASMPTPRADLTANVVGDKIYLIGGKIYSNTSPYYTQTDVTQVYDIKSNTWSTGASMPTAVQGYASAVVGTKIYIIGGSRQSASGMDVSTSTVQIFDTKTDIWTTGQPLNYPSSYGAAVATTGIMAPTKIYYMGGGSSGTLFSDKTQIYNVAQDSWSEGPKMLATRAYLGATTVNDILYVIGGFDGDNWSNATEALKPEGYGTVPPIIEILSPENKTYRSVDIEYKINKPVSWVRFSLDNAQNVTLTQDTQTLNIPDGSHSILLFASDDSGNIGASQRVYFTIDNAAPSIIILSPLNQTYNNADVILTFVVDKHSLLTYSLDGRPEVRIAGNITLPALTDGTHTIIIRATDELGNSGTSGKLVFTISTFPTFWVVTIIVLAIIFVSLGYIIIKHKKSYNNALTTNTETDSTPIQQADDAQIQEEDNL